MGREYWKLWSASTVSALGDGISAAALPLLAASLTREPGLIAGLTFAFTLPWLLFGLVSGALVDRWDRRTILVWTNVVRAAIVGTLAAAVLLDAATLPLAYAIAFLHGSADTLAASAAPALVPRLVTPDHLERANGRLAAAATVNAEFVGPPVGAFLFAAAAVAPFAADAASFGAAALVVLAIRGRFRAARPRTDPTTLWAEVGAGLQLLWREPLLRALGATVAVLGIVDAAWFSILVLYALDVLGTSEAGYGFFLAAGAVGSVVGSLGASRATARLGASAVLAGALLVAAATQLVLGLTSSVGVALAMLAGSGLAFGLWNVVAVSVRQRLAPDELLGRINGAYRFLGVGGYSVGAASGGVVAHVLGIRAPFLVGVPLLVAAAVALVAVASGPAARPAR